MSLAGETPQRRVAAEAHRTERHLNRAHSLLDAEETRFLENNLSGKITLELFYRKGALCDPPQVTAKVSCEA